MTADDKIKTLTEALSAADSHIDKGHYEMARNITRAALAASRAATDCQQPDLVTAERVLVKPLVWDDNPSSALDCAWIDDFGLYQITDHGVLFIGNNHVGKQYPTIEAAKAAAQADYDARIRAALDLTPAPAVEPRTVIGGDASVAVCPICDIAGCKHVRGESPAVEPVAWRWKLKGASIASWDLVHGPEFPVRNRTRDELDVEPLYANQPAATADDTEALRAEVERLTASVAQLEGQALKDRKSANAAMSDALMWQFSVADGLHDGQPLLVTVWRQRKEAERRAAAAEARVAQLSLELCNFADANHRQALCINFTASALGPDVSATVDGLPKAARHVMERAEAAEARVAQLEGQAHHRAGRGAGAGNRGADQGGPEGPPQLLVFHRRDNPRDV